MTVTIEAVADSPVVPSEPVPPHSLVRPPLKYSVPEVRFAVGDVAMRIPEADEVDPDSVRSAARPEVSLSESREFPVAPTVRPSPMPAPVATGRSKPVSRSVPVATVPPKPVSTERPAYPKSARASGAHGTAIIQVLVPAKDGGKSVCVYRSSGTSALVRVGFRISG